MDNIIIEVEDSKSLLIQEDSKEVRLRNLFHVNEMMGGTYWLLDDKNQVKFKLNANQVKVIKVAMAMVNPKEKIDPTQPPVSYTFTIDKLLEIMGNTNNRLKYEDMPSFLTELNASDNFNYRDAKGKLILMHIFDRVVYDPVKQEVTFRFSWSMLERFLTIESRKDGEYQSYKIGNIMNFQSVHTISLYELFKMRLKGQKQVNFEIDILDLKTALDLYNKEKPEDEKYPRYYDLKKNVIDKSIKEINETKDIDVEVGFFERKKGRTAVSIVFQIKSKIDRTRIKLQGDAEDEISADKNEEAKQQNQSTAKTEEEFKIESKIREIIGEEMIRECGKELTTNSCLTIYKKAKGSYEFIKQQVDIAKNQGGIKNIGKWLNSALTNGGYKPKKVDNFNNYPQRVYDYDSLEPKLLGWNGEETEDNSEQIDFDDMLKKMRTS